jgi:hypothetical protein
MRPENASSFSMNERLKMKCHALTIIASFSVTALFPMLGVGADLSPNAGASNAPRANSSAQSQRMPRPDLIVQSLADTKLPMFTVKNIGNAQSPPSMVQVHCHTVTGIACSPNVHYNNVPASPPSPGTMMTAPNVWRISIGALDALDTPGGHAKLHLSVLPKNQTAGLKFSVCADIGATVNESNETNNCATWVFKPPQ